MEARFCWLILFVTHRGLMNAGVDSSIVVSVDDVLNRGDYRSVYQDSSQVAERR